MSGVSLEEKIKDCERWLNYCVGPVYRHSITTILCSDQIVNIARIVAVANRMRIDLREIAVERDGDGVKAYYRKRDNDLEHFHMLIDRMECELASSISYADYKRAIQITEEMK